MAALSVGGAERLRCYVGASLCLYMDPWFLRVYLAASITQAIWVPLAHKLWAYAVEALDGWEFLRCALECTVVVLVACMFCVSREGQ